MGILNATYLRRQPNCTSALTSENVKLSLTNFLGCQNWAGAAACPENLKFLDLTENCCSPTRFKKKSLLLHS